jgi:hypothetical protein
MNQDISVFLNPIQVTGDSGESNRVSKLTTTYMTKRHNANLSVATIIFLEY